MATRRKRLPAGRAVMFLEELAILPIAVEQPLSFAQAKSVFAFSEQHGLTFYDAAYLEFARRFALPLATLDTALIKAASSETVQMIR